MKKILKEDKLYKKIEKLCKKYKITYQLEKAYNDDWHLKFRKKIGRGESSKYSFYTFEYAECFISINDVKDKRNKSIISNLKGFLKISFRIAK